MRISLTFDHELYFGTPSGSAEQCLLKPADALLNLARKYNMKFTWFVDAGYLMALQKYALAEPSLAQDFAKIREQLRVMVEEGHEIGLHIHPHWDNSKFVHGQWIHPTQGFKLSDYKQEEAEEIVRRYNEVLKNVTGYIPVSYRAGGWCLQPFAPLKNVFEEIGIQYDSTVFKGGYYQGYPFDYDFRKTPSTSKWNFSDDICKEDKDGKFLELPINSTYLSPAFYWNLFVQGRLNKSLHKGMGDGNPIPAKGLLKKYLSQGAISAVSTDGYLVNSLFKVRAENKKDFIVTIGHPKATSFYTLQRLEEYAKKYSGDEFVTLRQIGESGFSGLKD